MSVLIGIILCGAGMIWAGFLPMFIPSDKKDINDFCNYLSKKNYPRITGFSVEFQDTKNTELCITR